MPLFLRQIQQTKAVVLERVGKVLDSELADLMQESENVFQKGLTVSILGLVDQMSLYLFSVITNQLYICSMKTAIGNM